MIQLLLKISHRSFFLIFWTNSNLSYIHLFYGFMHFFLPQETASGYSCKCESGWAGVNCTENINECLSNPCLNGGTCVDGVNTFSCECTSSWTGSHCQISQQGMINISYVTDTNCSELKLFCRFSSLPNFLVQLLRCKELSFLAVMVQSSQGKYL